MDFFYLNKLVKVVKFGLLVFNYNTGYYYLGYISLLNVLKRIYLKINRRKVVSGEKKILNNKSSIFFSEQNKIKIPDSIFFENKIK